MNGLSVNLSPNAPLFGWSRKNPPDPGRYLLDVSSANDEFVKKVRIHGENLWDKALNLFSRNVLFQPTQALIDRVALELFDEEGPRFIALTGLFKNRGFTKKQVYNFQENIIEEINKIRGYRIRTEKTILGQPRIGFETSIDLHYDDFYNRQTPIMSVAYGPFKGLSIQDGGVPQLGDLKQWAQDNTAEDHSIPKLNLASEDASLYRVAKNFRHVSTVKEEVIKDYAIELEGLNLTEDMPIVVVNNNHFTGVLHGATPFQKGLCTEHKERPLNRISATSKAEITPET